jgi:hypothetical protein
MKTSIETVTTEKTLKLKLEDDHMIKKNEELYYVFKKHQLETKRRRSTTTTKKPMGWTCHENGTQ